MLGWLRVGKGSARNINTAVTLRLDATDTTLDGVGVKRNRFFICDACSRPPVGRCLMLRLDLWERICARQKDYYCEACIKRKLGRPLLLLWDFKQPWWPYNRLPSQRPKWTFPANIRLDKQTKKKGVH